MKDIIEYEENKANSKKTLFISLIVLVITLLIVGFLLFKTFGTKKESGSFKGFGFGGSGQQVTSVRTIIAEKSDLHDFILTNGEIETQNSVDVYPSIGGKVVQINVALGSHVNKGDIIGYIDPSEPGSVYAKSPVTASISGSILTSPIRPGQKVSTNSVITRIGDINNLQVRAKVAEKYISELKINQKAEITLEAYPNVIFEASVSRISPVVDSLTRTKEILLTFNKADSRINAGMFANIKLYTSVYSGAITIQQDSIVNNSDKNYLYVVNQDCTVTKREVTLGHNVNGYYQITSGIETGEIVVTEGMLTLFDGATISDISGNIKMPETYKDKDDMPPMDLDGAMDKKPPKDKKNKKD